MDYATAYGGILGPAIVPAVGILYVGGFAIFESSFSMNSLDDKIKVKEEMPDLFEKINHLRDDILIYFRKRGTPDEIFGGEAFGNNFGSISSFMVIDEDMANSVDADALHFIYKHEIGHIYYNQKFKFVLIITVIMTVALYVFNHLSNQLPWWVRLCVGVCLVCLQILLTKRIYDIAQYFDEQQADDFAIEHSTDQELIGGRRFFQAQEESEQDFKEVFTKAYPEGRIRFYHPHHPLGKERVKKVEREMDKRKIDVVALDRDPDYLQAKETIKEYEFKCLMHKFKPEVAKFDENCSKFDAAMNEFFGEKLSLA